jgi:hypothetical protein
MAGHNIHGEKYTMGLSEDSDGQLFPFIPLQEH